SGFKVMIGWLLSLLLGLINSFLAASGNFVTTGSFFSSFLTTSVCFFCGVSIFSSLALTVFFALETLSVSSFVLALVISGDIFFLALVSSEALAAEAFLDFWTSLLITEMTAALNSWSLSLALSFKDFNVERMLSTLIFKSFARSATFIHVY